MTACEDHAEWSKVEYSPPYVPVKMATAHNAHGSKRDPIPLLNSLGEPGLFFRCHLIGHIHEGNLLYVRNVLAQTTEIVIAP